MRVGLFVNPQAPSEDSARSLFDGMVSMAKTAERVGFDHLSAGQHFLSDFTQIQLIPYLSRLTAEVEDMEISTAGLVLPLLQPIDVAESMATLDVMNDEQTYLGVVAGYRDVEFDNFGVDKGARGARMKEGVEILQRLFSEQSVDYDGDQWSIEGATLPFHPENGIPVWMGANSNVAVRRAAAISDGWLIAPHSTISEVQEQKVEHYDPIREERGESERVPIIRECFVDESHDAAVEMGREYLSEKYQRYVDWGQHEAMEDASEFKLPFDELAEDRFLLGTPAEVTEELERYDEELDASHVLLRIHWPGLPYDRANECVELIGDEVIPNL